MPGHGTYKNQPLNACILKDQGDDYLNSRSAFVPHPIPPVSPYLQMLLQFLMILLFVFLFLTSAGIYFVVWSEVKI